MADVNVPLTLPVLQKGVDPVRGPTVVRRLQTILNQRGVFPALVVDGKFGPKTEVAVRHYQQNENLTVDGIVNQETWSSLLSRWLLDSEPG